MKKYTARVTTIIAALLSLLWVFGFAWSIEDFYNGEVEALEKKPAEAENDTKMEAKDMTVVALGDSLTRGTGDDSGMGYVGLVTEELKERLAPKDIQVYNLGINGQTSAQLLQQLGELNIGRQLAEADVILMTIGGNDLFQQGDTLFDLNLAKVQELQQTFLANLQQIFTFIRQHNPQASVFILGLYNPFIDLEDSDTTNKIVMGWNHATELTTGQFEKIVFVPTFDLFQLSVNEYLYTDKFHPNHAGYQLISDRLAPLINWEKEIQPND
ncbi:SGNH/GDSL hydrolase family protein [Bacillus tuaregi]|uniref:SGNH/GDSL hydrolase family protein n=1 Tax=Bacillus tuaregi TaxID=1816695 RepID=UPI000B0A39A1|nr:SGNH/GDSL hydrolase family protein [Bacillus tuaregi]